MNRAISLVLLALLGVGLSTPSNAQFSKLVTFGDSVSDTGNIASVTFNFPYPFYQNRISNSLVLADYLAASIGSNANPSLHLAGETGGSNYAILGGNIVGGDREDLAAQVDAYLARNGGQADSGALFLVLIGGNDLRDVRSIKTSSIAQAQLDTILTSLIDQLQRLIEAGVKNLVVPNVADIGGLPETLKREASDPGVSQRANEYTRYFNLRLQQALLNVERGNRVRILSFDLFAAFNSVLNRASQLGFQYSQIGCFELSGFDFHPDCDNGRRFDRFVFFDSLHPSGKTHQLIAQALIAQLRDEFSGQATINMAPIISLILSD